MHWSEKVVSGKCENNTVSDICNVSFRSESPDTTFLQFTSWFISRLR